MSDVTSDGKPAGSPQEPIWPPNTPLPQGIEATQVDAPTAIGAEDLVNRFGFHKATIEGPNNTKDIHARLRIDFLSFAHHLNTQMPPSREASLAFTALEEASMWFHKAIAKNDELQEEN